MGLPNCFVFLDVRFLEVLKQFQVPYWSHIFQMGWPALPLWPVRLHRVGHAHLHSGLRQLGPGSRLLRRRPREDQGLPVQTGGAGVSGGVRPLKFEVSNLCRDHYCHQYCQSWQLGGWCLAAVRGQNLPQVADRGPKWSSDLELGLSVRLLVHEGASRGHGGPVELVKRMMKTK